MHLPQGLGHAETGWVQGPALIVVQDATDRGAIIQHDILVGLLTPDRRVLGLFYVLQGVPSLLQRGDGEAWEVGGPPGAHNVPFERPHPSYGTPPLHLGAASCFQDGLGDLAEKMMRTITVWHPWKLRRDPAHERVLFIRHPEPHPFAQPLGPHTRLDQQLLDLGRRTGQQGLRQLVEAELVYQRGVPPQAIYFFQQSGKKLIHK